MIIGIGCDIVEHNMTKKLKWQSDVETLQRIFSQKELDLYSSKKTIRFLAGRFAAKEAVLKCMGTGMYDGICLTDIQILSGKFGNPKLVITGEVKKISDKLGVDTWHVSISHTTSHSSAFVVAEARLSSELPDKGKSLFHQQKIRASRKSK